MKKHSIEKRPTQNNEKILFANEESKRIEAYYKHDSEAIQKIVLEIVSKLNDLQSCIKREKMASVVEDIQKGEFVHACENVHHNFPSFHIGTMAELLLLSYSDIENLRHVINFLKCIKHGTLAATGVVTVYEEMKFKSQTGHGEILMLQQEFGTLVELPRAIKTQIDADCEKVVGRIVQDIANKEYAFSKYISESLGRRVLNTVIPLVIERFFSIFSGTVDEILLLIYYSQNLDNVLHTFEIVKNTEAKLKSFGLLNSEQAMHLWIHATNKLRIKIDFNLGKNFSLLKNQYLSTQKNAYFQIYQSYLEGVKGNYEQLHSINSDLEEILVEFTSFYYDGSFDRTNQLISASMKLKSLKANGYILNTLYTAMEKNKNVHSFNAFKIFHRLRLLDEIATEEYTQELQELRYKVPRCIIRLLWGDTKKNIRIINKFYREPLCTEEFDTCVVSWVPGDLQKNQVWSLDLDKKTSLAKFTHILKVENLGIGVVFQNNYAAVSTRGEDWMLKHADDEYFKIYSPGGKNFGFWHNLRGVLRFFIKNG